jgi:hypothetical protein
LAFFGKFFGKSFERTVWGEWCHLGGMNEIIDVQIQRDSSTEKPRARDQYKHLVLSRSRS